MTRDELASAEATVLKKLEGGKDIPLAEFAAPLIDVLVTLARRYRGRLLLRVDVRPDEPVSMTLEVPYGTNGVKIGRFTLQKDGAGVWCVL